jgi:hypothetical protein
MPHPAELIQKIRALVERDYPSHLYQYQTESIIPGTRMFPDILVTKRGGGMVCAVEVGYTRPEKLTAYRDQLKIPDVRWYDKQGKLHADVRELAVALTVQAEPVSTFYVYQFDGQIVCDDCYTELAEHLDDDCDGDCDCDGDPANPGDPGDLLDQASAEVSTILVTDYVKVFFACFCDICGREWFEDDAEDIKLDFAHFDAESIRLGLQGDLREFAKQYGARSLPMHWKDCVELVRNRFHNLELRYEDGWFINPDYKREWHGTVLKVRQTALQPIKEKDPRFVGAGQSREIEGGL